MTYGLPNSRHPKTNSNLTQPPTKEFKLRLSLDRRPRLQSLRHNGREHRQGRRGERVAHADGQQGAASAPHVPAAQRNQVPVQTMPVRQSQTNKIS